MKFAGNVITNGDVLQIDAEFLSYFQNEDPQLFRIFGEYRGNNVELTAKLIIDIGKILDGFLLGFFDIVNLPNIFDDKLPFAKRNFVQRRVFVKYQNLEVLDAWEGCYRFQSESQFVDDVLSENENLLSEMEKFTAFVLFTKEGWKKYGHYEVFNLPKAIERRQDYFVKHGNAVYARDEGERRGFNLTDTPPQKQTIDWNLYYCLYCHNRGKDSCSKGLNDEKNGCPLRQDISESIYVKKEGFAIGALAIIMRENPFCIITGRRICNDCELACIFQKQEPVDIQSVETAILNDVLMMNFGLEVYHLLLLWNPLNIKNMADISGKTIGIAGAGPAGMFAGYLFTKAGGRAVIFDALNIQISEKIKFLKKNAIKNIDDFLNESLERRVPSNVGGVMEYGITVRWNKNYLDLLVALLLRFGVEFIGSVRVGGLLNYDDICGRMKFNHFALCVGSAMPQLPEDLPSVFTGYKLTGGVMMASDFLMSLHINRGSDDLKNFRQKSVYIVGCGLTAIDAACEIRALLLQNGVQKPDVKIVYYREFEQSAAYRTNFLEFQKALGEGVGVLENSKIVKIHKNGNGIFAIEMPNGDILPCDLLLIAIGTKPNIEHIQSFAGRSDVSFFGDCNPLYTGSVVKALASVKNGIESAIFRTQKNENTFDDKSLLWLKKDVKNVRKVQEDLYEIEIESPILFEKAEAGNVLKLQIMGRNSIALTITHKNDGNIYGYLFNTNKETQVLIDGFFKGETIHINGINCKNFPNVDGKSVIIASQKLAYIFGKVHKDNRIILLDDFVQYEKNTHYVLAIENDEKLLAVRQVLPDNSYDVINFQKMNCMLGGICGRCVTDSGSYGCL